MMYFCNNIHLMLETMNKYSFSREIFEYAFVALDKFDPTKNTPLSLYRSFIQSQILQE